MDVSSGGRSFGYVCTSRRIVVKLRSDNFIVLYKVLTEIVLSFSGFVCGLMFILFPRLCFFLPLFVNFF